MKRKKNMRDVCAGARCFNFFGFCFLFFGFCFIGGYLFFVFVLLVL